jgi:hypothetical protein
MTQMVHLKICAGCKRLSVIWKSLKKEKYCKVCWYKIQPPHSISSFSKRRIMENTVYSTRRIAYLALHNVCEAKLPGCGIKAIEIHHKAGRIGENLTRISGFLAVCRSCHDEIEADPEMAKELGFSISRLD